MSDVRMITELIDVQLLKKQNVQAIVLSTTLVWVFPVPKPPAPD